MRIGEKAYSRTAWVGLTLLAFTKFDDMERQLETYSNWLEKEKEKVRRFKVFINDTLNCFMLAQYKQTRIKTLKLPNAYKLTLRKGQEKLDITDEDKLVLWAKQHAPSLLSVKVSPNKTAIKNRLKGTGELPPGCEITHNNELSFKFSKI